MAKTVIIGAGGQLGRELSAIFPSAIKIYHKSSDGDLSLDISNLDEVESLLNKLGPEVVINAAALANVDTCEKDHRLAYFSNGIGPGRMANICSRIGAKFVHVSTDYVFNGSEGNYTEKSIPDPINYYGLSKLIGDSMVLSIDGTLVVRTSGVFGYTKNFPLFVLETLKSGKKVNAIRGYYSPIHAHNLALSIEELINLGRTGLINVAGERISRYKLALRIAEEFSLDSTLVDEVDKVASMGAKRPYDSSLDSSIALSVLDSDFHTTSSNLKVMKETQKAFDKGN